MTKQSIALFLLLFTASQAYSQFPALVSITPNSANKQQTLITTITGTDLFFTSATAPDVGEINLMGPGVSTYADSIHVIDNDHFIARWTFGQNLVAGIYSLTYWTGANGYILNNCFTLTDTCTISVSKGAICPGDSSLLTASAASTYQWKLNGVNITGATQQQYYAKNPGSYTVTVTGSNCITIPPVTITQSVPPTAVISPSGNQQICIGQQLILNETSGSGGYQYQWIKDGVNLQYSTTNSYLIVKETGSYQVLVSTQYNACKTLSAPTNVTVVGLPMVNLVKQPGSTYGKDALLKSNFPNTNFGNSTELNCAVIGLSNPYLHRGLFQFDLTSIPPGSTIISANFNLFYDSTSTSGATTQSGTNNFGYMHRVTASWKEDSVTWNTMPAYTLGTTSAQLPASTGYYQDYLNLNMLNGTKFHVDNPTLNYGYLMLLSGELYGNKSLLFCSSDDLNPARRPKLVVDYLMATITSNKGSKICSNDSAILQADTGAYTYQWLKNGVAISGATGQKYVAKTAGSYTVIVTNSLGCSVSSKPKTLAINTAPTAFITPEGPTTFCNGDSVVLKGPYNLSYSYQWKKNNGNISGATNRKYTAKTAGSYKVKTTAANGCTALSTATTITIPCRDGEISNSDASFSVAVYPNPSSGDFNLQINNGTFDMTQVRIYDMMGQLVKEIKMTAGVTELDLQLDKPGFYKAEIIQGRDIDVVSLMKIE